MPDIQQLAESTLGRVERLSVKAELKRAGEIIQPGEDVAMLAVGSYTGSGNNLIIVTDRRLIAINEVGAFNKRLHVQDITYDRITHVQSEDSRINGRVILATAGGEIEGSKFRRSAMGTIKGYGTKWLP